MCKVQRFQANIANAKTFRSRNLKVLKKMKFATYASADLCYTKTTFIIYGNEMKFIF